MTPADGFIFAAPTLAEAPELAALLGVEAFPRHRREVVVSDMQDAMSLAECECARRGLGICPSASPANYARFAARHRSDR